MPNSPYVLHRASMPSTWQGCDEILGDRYHNKIPLPRIPPYRGTGNTGPVLLSHAQARTEAKYTPTSLAYAADTRLDTAD